MSRAKNEEVGVAMEIVRFLMGRDAAQKVNGEGDTVSFRVDPRPGWKLRLVVFSRRALRKLASDPAREVKLDYLRRDLLRAAGTRAEYRYPRQVAKQSLLPLRPCITAGSK
jgi:hypothetical protein